MKKISILFLMFVLLFTSIASAHTNTETIALEVIKVGQYTVNVLESSDVFEKIEVINEKTGEVEYVESFLEEKYPRYVITTNENKFVVMGAEEKISLYKNDGLLEEFDKNDLFEIAFSQNPLEITPLSFGPWGSWIYTEPNLAIYTTVPTVLAAILAARAGLIPASEFIAVSGGLISIGASYIWLRIGERHRFDSVNQLHQINKHFQIYLNSDRTNLYWENYWIIEQNFMDSIPDPIY